jgi:hypothetical protein
MVLVANPCFEACLPPPCHFLSAQTASLKGFMVKINTKRFFTGDFVKIGPGLFFLV